MPCNESASTMGVDELLTYGSMHCVRASNPVCAVTSLGIDKVSSGSITTTLGNMNGCLIDTLRSPASSTEFFVTSAPGPAVVGTAMNGAHRFVSARARPTTSRKSYKSGCDPPFVSTAATHFPVSTGVPPPIAMTQAHALSTATLIAASAVATVGSPAGWWYTNDSTPASRNEITSGALNRSDTPATINTGLSAHPSSSVSSLTKAGTRALVPQPNTTRAAVANSKGATVAIWSASSVFCVGVSVGAIRTATRTRVRRGAAGGRTGLVDDM
mmetsp:Transcript_1732/g.5902  ORF Transcript_1732/g.5902 Transcript_1732/m.5902 type:complete len:271 (+) Transcript_1732:595-1407(+)